MVIYMLIYIGMANLNQLKSNGRPRIGKTILCIETGKIYHSTREAATDVGVTSNGIVKCCNGKRNICAGYHWRYLE